MSKRPLFAVAAVIVALTVAASASRAQNLITNGDFSTDADNSHFVFGGYGSVPDWSFTGAGGSAGVNGPNISPGYFAPANATTDNMGNAISNFAFLQIQSGGGAATLFQTFDVTAGTTYELTYDAAARNGYNGNQLVAEITDGTAPDAGTVLFEQNSFSLTGDKFYTNTTSGFTTSVGTGLMFTADQTGAVTLAFSVDNLSGGTDETLDFTNVVVSTAPEPSTYALMIGGLAGLIFVARRRSARA